MDLIQFDGSEVVLRLYPSDCATLAQVLAVAEAELDSEADRPLKKAAGNYAALFRALSLGTVAPGRLTPWHFDYMSEDLAGLQSGEE
jgi:hypothetical protein